jgi:trans-2,3-dihydro-3-hydroxyanthranilate isomerase
MPRSYPFVWLDVFARTPLEGNQLAVFPDARGLSDEEMQAIARETHLSETTFVFPQEEKVDRVSGFTTRIFAVSGEMPFAGHPTLGTASVLARKYGAIEVALRLKVGRIPVIFSEREGRPFGEMVQVDPTVGQTHDPKVVAKALNVSKSELDPKAPIQTVSTGVPFAIVPFRSLEVLSQLRPDPNTLEQYLRGTDAKYFYLVSRETVDPAASLHARMIFSGGEDPATGSAAGPAVAWMVLHGWLRPGQPAVFEQGLEIHRRSLIHGRADLRGGKPVNVRIGGFCADVIRGELTLPSS